MKNNDQLIGYIIGLVEGSGLREQHITIPLSWISGSSSITGLTTVMCHVASYFNKKYNGTHFLWDCSVDGYREIANVNCFRKNQVVRYTVAQLEEKLGHKIEIVSEV